MKLYNGGESIMHMFICFIVAMIVAVLMAHTTVPAVFCCLTGFTVAMAAGFGKEYGDSKAPGNIWSWSDIFWNFIGALIGGLFGLVSFLIW